MAFAIAVLVWLSRYHPMSEVVQPAHLHDLGKLLFAFVMLWAYFSYSQFLIIWSGNLPEEIPFYLTRTRGFLGVLALAIVIFHFALPFVMLLSRGLKRNARLIGRVAVLLLAVRAIDLMWMITPAFEHQPAVAYMLDVAAVVGLFGLWTWFFVRQLKDRPLVPVNDPYLAEALEHGTAH
jgi:hypothetical protein